jgi:putative ABC transport system permease protein
MTYGDIKPFNWLYENVVSWWVFSLAGILVALVAVVTISFNALKAAVASPMKSLRTE